MMVDIVIRLDVGQTRQAAPNLANLPGWRQPKWLKPRSSIGWPAETKFHATARSRLTDVSEWYSAVARERISGRRSSPGSDTSSS